MSARRIMHTPFGEARTGARGGRDPCADGNCLWCGEKLPASRLHPELVKTYPLRGGYADGAFCTMRCGYAFGVEAAIQGMRFRNVVEGKS